MFRIPTLASVATVAGVAVGLVLAGPAPAHAIPFTTSAVLIDSDHVVVADPTAATMGFTGDATIKLDRNYLRVAISGIFKRSTATAGCRAARAIFTYADGSTTNVTSPRLCQEFGTYRSDPVFWSHDDRTVVKYAVQVLSATDSTAPLTVIAGNTEFVGDAPDSLGTATRLDHDTHQLVMTGSLGRKETMFQGSSDFFLQRHDVSSAGFTWWTTRARVTGTLTWSDLITGSEAYLSVTWYYSDGSQSSAISDKVVRGSTPTKTVTLTSSSTKYIVSVKMGVYSNQAGLGSFSSGAEAKFGDGSGAA